MASDDRIRLSPDDRNCCVSKLQLLAYGSTSYVASSSIMKYAHQVPDRPEQMIRIPKGHLQPLNIMISLIPNTHQRRRKLFCIGQADKSDREEEGGYVHLQLQIFS